MRCAEAKARFLGGGTEICIPKATLEIASATPAKAGVPFLKGAGRPGGVKADIFVVLRQH